MSLFLHQLGNRKAISAFLSHQKNPCAKRIVSVLHVWDESVFLMGDN